MEHHCMNNSSTLFGEKNLACPADAATDYSSRRYFVSGYDDVSFLDVLKHPSYILVILVPIQFLTHLLLTSKQTQFKPGRFNTLRIILALLLVVIPSWLSRHSDVDLNITKSPKHIFFETAENEVVVYIFVVFLTFLEKLRISNMTLPLFFFWFAKCVSLLFLLYEESDKDANYTSTPTCWIDLSQVFIVFLQGCLVCLREKSREFHQLKTTYSWIHPQDEASWFGDFTLHWTTKYIQTATKRTLTHSDAYDLVERDRCGYAATKFEQNLKIEELRKEEQNIRDKFKCKVTDYSKDSETTADKNQQKEMVQISLIRILIKTFGLKLFALQTLEGMAELNEFVTPVLMGAFMNHIKNRENENWLKGVAFVVGIFIMNGFTHILHRRIYSATCRHLKRMRNSIIISVFKKSLVIKNECLNSLTTGEIVNLVSDDADRVFDACQELFHIVTAPITIGVSMYLLFNMMGSAMFVGLFIMVILIPLNRYIGKSIKSLYTKKDKTRDKRIKLMNEIINGIRMIKLWAWEQSFMQKVRDVRGQEEECNKVISLFRAGVDSMFNAIPYLVKIGSFGVYLLLGGRVDATTGFITIHLFEIMSHPFSFMAMFIPTYVEAYVSLRRIEKFISCDDIPQNAGFKKSETSSTITIKDGEFTWDGDRGKNTLRNINLEIPKGSLVAVVGMVGSGKSSLLSAMLGEMEQEKGVVEIESKIAYVPQEAWILNTSLQDNVLFGSCLESARYTRVIEACALNADIDSMRAGDKTEIGEKGINLSGGQKQRVSLARAIYSDGDVYLLDDPLSAVDAHVGKHIFNEVIGPKGLLHRKTRVLVTHGVHWLPHVDSIIVMKDGEIVESGTYERLMSQDGIFAQLLQNIAKATIENPSSKEPKSKRKTSHRMNSTESNHSLKCDDAISVDDSNSDDPNGSDSECSEDNSSDTDDESGDLIVKDELEDGHVKYEVYLEYIKAVGYGSVFTFILIFLISSFFDAYSDHVLLQWTEDPALANTSSTSSEEYTKLNREYFFLYSLGGGIEVTGSFLYFIVCSRGTFKASTRLHNNLLYNILRCPMSFFDTVPSSRILTRFSKDVRSVDSLGSRLRDLICHFFDILILLAMIAIHCPAVSFYIASLSVAYFFLFKYHIGSIRQLKRFMSKYRPPIFAHFTETLNGLGSIRAYGCQRRFIEKMENHVDQFTKVDLMEMWCELFLELRAGFLYLFMILLVGLVCVFDTSMSAGMVALVVMYAESASTAMEDLCWNLTHVETDLVSLERLIEYSNKPSEAEWDIEETKPPSDWPSEGSVTFSDYKARYRQELDLVLKGVNCDIKCGEKVGIVGRTGAGKTSLIMALFRLIEPAHGSITVDGKSISGLGLHSLRSRITILPQQPVIFSGTLKMNLDPFGRSSDEDIWTALRRSHLATFVNSLPNQLEFKCGEGGKNLSVGQRQLLCLARTLLRKTKILVLDEATAAVDIETDELIQTTIRTEFRDCTVITIAHRINTIMDYDRVLVLENGTVKEFDTPTHLLGDRESIFYTLAKDAKIV